MTKLPKERNFEAMHETNFNCPVLLVEDDFDSLDVTRLQLELLGGFCVDVAQTASEVLDIMQARCETGQDCFELVILDIDLPDVLGTTLAEWIRAKYPLVPIILYTGYGKLPAFVDAVERLGVKLLTKPLEPIELIGACRAVIRDGQPLPSQAIPIPRIFGQQIRDIAAKRINKEARSLP